MRYGHCYFHGPVNYGGGVSYVLVAAQSTEDASTWKAEIAASGVNEVAALHLALEQTSSGHPAHKAISEELTRQQDASAT
jgi:hypothetical protein